MHSRSCSALLAVCLIFALRLAACQEPDVDQAEQQYQQALLLRSGSPATAPTPLGASWWCSYCIYMHRKRFTKRFTMKLAASFLSSKSVTGA